MCTSPILIKNPRKHFIQGVDNAFVSVPCGRCLECRNKKRNEIYFLSFFEHLQACSKGGFTQFFTLTYNENSLPRFGNKPCFSRTDIQKYLKRVNSACRRYFGSLFRFRYLCTCEYGDTTKRPHYHLLVYVQQPCSHYQFRRILRECWPYGWSFGSFDNFGVINRPEGIRYVTKYVAKDMFDNDEDKDWLDEMYSFSDSIWYRARRVLPFTLKSKNYGYYSISHIFDTHSTLPHQWRTPLDTLLTGRILCPCHDGAPQLVNLPNSLKRKLFYTITWRYRRITPKDKRRCSCYGKPVPKRKVESYYIPNHLHKTFFINQFLNRVEYAKKCACVSNSSHPDTIGLYSVICPEFTTRINNKNKLSLKDYVEKLADVAEVRDPIFMRDPFDGDKFLFKRYSLDVSDIPELVEFQNALYNSGLSLENMLISYDIKQARYVVKTSHDVIEKTQRDVKHLKYA